MNWLAYTLISVTCISFSMIIQRVLMHRHKFSAPAFSSLSQFVVAGAVLPFALLHGISFAGFGDVLPLIVLSSLAFGAGSIVYYKTLRVVEASMFSILFATSSFWVMVIGVVALGEHLSSLQIIGTIIVFSSVAILIKNIRDFRFDRGILLGLATGLLYGIAVASSAYVGRKVDIPTWVFVSFFTGGLVSLCLMPSAIRKYPSMLQRQHLPTVGLFGLLYAVGNAALSYAYKLGPFSVVSPLRQTGVIVTTLLALAILHDERNNIPRKLTAAVLCTAGVVLLVL